MENKRIEKARKRFCMIIIKIWLREKIIEADAIESWTGIEADRTIEDYGMKTQQKIHSVAEAMKE